MSPKPLSKIETQSVAFPSGEFANCLNPLLEAVGWTGHARELHEALPHQLETMEMDDLLNTMANLKYESKSVKTRLRHIDTLHMPCLFISDRGNVQVLLKKEDDQILIYDGDSAKYCQIAESQQKGTVVFFRSLKNDTVSLLSQQEDWFRKILARFKKIFLLGALTSFILSIIAVVSPLFVMTIYDQVLSADSVDTLWFLGIGIIIFILADVGFRLIRSYLFTFVSIRFANIVGNEVMRRILYLPSSFTETAALGSQVARIKDFDSVKDFFGGPAMVALFEIPFLIVLIGTMFAIGGSLALVPLVAIALFVIFGAITIPISKRVNANAAQSGTARQTFVLEMLSNLQTIKYTGNTKYWAERYRNLSAEAVMDSYSASRYIAFIEVSSQALVASAGIATMSIGVLNVLAGSMSMGSLIASMLLVWRVLAPLRTGFGVVAQVEKIQKSVKQLNRLMNFRLENKLEGSLTQNQQLKGDVSIVQASIRYSPDAHPALLGVNLQVSQGENLVIIGHDGAGKTTLLKLILGLYHPQAGRVMIDNVNVKQMAPLSLRQSIAYTPQHDQVFYGTIAQNIRFSDPLASDEELYEAARKATILDDILNLSDGFETRINTDNLTQFTSQFRSGIGLARMFLRKSKLLLLDEPEHGINPLNEAAFLDELKSLKGKATVIISTHNTNYFPLADRVLWLEKGRIKKAGPASEVVPLYLKQLS